MGVLALGIDLGTTSVKVVIFDSRQSRIKKEVTLETQAHIISEDPLRNEQNIMKIFESLSSLLQTLDPEDLRQVGTIGISGQMHGVVFWAKDAWTWSSTGDFKVDRSKVSHLITWQDSRCTPAFLSSLPQPNSHLGVHTGFGVATGLWLHRNEPEFLDKFDYAGTIQDFLVCALINNKSRPLMSPQNAASWGYFNTSCKSWNTEILQKAGFPTRLLPQVTEETMVGCLYDQWNGISIGVKIGSALGDLQASVYSTFGTGTKDTSGVAFLNISTSAQLAVVMPPGFEPCARTQNSAPDGIEFFPYFQGRYLAVAASLTGGNCLATFVNTLSTWIQELGCEVDKDNIWLKLLSSADQCQTTDLVVCPTLFGERSDPQRRASVQNISDNNLTLGNFSRAICRGIARNLAELMPSDFFALHGVKTIYGSGSALLRNRCLMEEVSSAFGGITIELRSGGDSALGAAIFSQKFAEHKSRSDSQ